jgi:hypothetical protein
MKEILYIQAGSFANYIGTHFWNTQEAYITDDEIIEDHAVSHGTSFQERFSPQVCPLRVTYTKTSNGERLQGRADTLSQVANIRPKV